jgi:hypothetical protein
MGAITLRRALPEDAPAIAAVCDATVRVGWPYLGELSARPMFTSDQRAELAVCTDHDE